MRKIAIFMIMLLLVSHAENFVAINSVDGRDVLSGIYYANVKGLPVKFMPDTGDSAIFAAKVGSGHDIMLIQSEVPVSSFVESDLEAKNNTVEVYLSMDGGETNLDLAERSGATKFIIVDSAFSDSAISVLPYAAKTKAFVLHANKDNAQEIAEAVSGAESLMVYGYIDQAVEDAIAQYNPEHIGKGEDKFEDNVEMVERTLQEFPSETLVIVDGTALEESMALGEYPTLLAGRLVPQVTYDYLKSLVANDEITTVLLLGNELVVPIYDTREKMEQEFLAEGSSKTFSVVVKFAQVLPSEGTGVLVLDTFPMPAYKPALDIVEVFYNSEAKQVMVSLDNVGEGHAYYILETRVLVDGVDFEVFGGEETQLIERGAQVPISYDFDISEVPSGEVTAVVVVRFGSSKTSLEEFISEEGPLASVAYQDKSDVMVQSARYDDSEDILSVTIKNNADESAYVFSKVRVVLDGTPSNVTADTRMIEGSSLAVVEFPLELTDEDLEANKEVSVFLDYGAREGFLMKKAEFLVDLQREGGDMLLLIGIVAFLAVGVIAAAAVGLYLLKGKKKKAGR